MKLKMMKFVLLSTLAGILCQNIQKTTTYEECVSNSFLLATTLDDCSLCACFTGNSNLLSATRSSCVITEDVLERIMDQLFDAWRIITGTVLTTRQRVSSRSIQTQQNCSFSSENFRSKARTYSTNCNNLIAEIEGMIQDLTEQIRLLVAWLDDPENFNPRVVVLEQCLKCLNKKLDDTVARYEQNIGDIKEKFGEMQQRLTDSINQRKEEVRQLEILLEEKTYQLVTSNVIASDFATAFNEFAKLNNDTFLDTLVEDVYGSNKVENLLTFAYLLAKPEQRGHFYFKIFEFMQKNQHHLSVHILSVKKIVKDDIKRICYWPEPAYCTALPAIYRAVVTWVEPYAKNLIYSLAAEICKGNHKSVLVAGSSESEENLAGNALNDVLPDLIPRAYTKCWYNLHIISDFVRDLRWNKQKATGFMKLLSLVYDMNDKLKVAFKMKQALENMHGPDGQVEEAKDILLRLKSQLPSPVRNLVWHRSCTIRNFYQRYLYIFGSHNPDNFRLHLWEELVSSSRWIYEPIELDNGEYHFRIRNENTGDYLGTHVPWRNHNDQDGFVAARTERDKEYPPRNFHWQVQFVTLNYDFKFGDIKLFHVGRKATLTEYNQGKEVALDLYDGTGVAHFWTNICDE